MNNKFKFNWATHDDEADIRALVGSVPMPGAVSIIFAREPDYFLGTTIMGDPCDVLVIRQNLDGQLAGIACRAERRAYINGQESPLGYIGQIRVGEDFRGNWLVHRGAKFFREASPDGLLYTGVIASENPRVRELLTGARLPGGLQLSGSWGLTTCAIPLRPRRPIHLPGITIQPGSQKDLEEIASYLHLQGPRRQFFPSYIYDDFSEGLTLRGLKPEDIFIARQGDVIVGIMAAWDQAAYKQDLIDHYRMGLRLLRPFYNIAARLIKAKPLAAPGQVIPLMIASCICITEDNLSVMQVLLSACLENAYGKGKAFLMIGLSDQDPLLKVAQRYLHITYHSELFAVSWSDKRGAVLDDRVPYIEIASL
ncbi:MAG TPA: hypothetical protein ENF22_06610 [Chloroflexi bacterium]|nr:hypothetical protein [Chloroflexota bacterium]